MRTLREKNASKGGPRQVRSGIALSYHLTSFLGHVAWIVFVSGFMTPVILAPILLDKPCRADVWVMDPQ